jgi:pimeloyl-ACP methyl ester carboxylesterase
MAAPNSFSTIVHPFDSPTPHSCAYEIGTTGGDSALVFIGGLGDGPHTVDAIRIVAKGLEAHPGLRCSLFESRMASSFNGFGTSSLANDVADVSSLVTYLRSIGKKKIILMGHSTGCQV